MLVFVIAVVLLAGVAVTVIVLSSRPDLLGTAAPSTVQLTTTVAESATSVSLSSTSPQSSASGVSSTLASAASSTATSASRLVLDAPTTAWFSAVCAGQKDLEKYAGPNAGGTIEQARATIAKAYLSLSASAKRTVEALTKLPPPTIADGPRSKQLRLAQYSAIAAGYENAAASVTAARPATSADLKTVVDKAEAAVKAAVTKAADGAAPLPADYQIAIQALPACVGISG